MADVVQMVVELSDKASPALKKVGAAASDAGDKAASAAKKFSLSKDQMKLIGTAAVGVAAAFGGLVMKLTDTQNQLADASTRTGIATDTLAGLKLAAEGSGLAFDAVVGGLNEFPKRIADVARGTGEAKVAFERLGLSVLDQKNEMKSSDQVMKETLTLLNGVESQTEKAALATQIFGGSGAALMQSLSGVELEDFVKEAEKFGIKTGPAAALAAADMQRELAKFSLVTDRAIQTILEGFGSQGGAAGAVKGFGALIVGLSESFKEIMNVGRRSFGLITGTVTDLLMAIIGLGKAIVKVFSGDFKAAGDNAKKALKDLSFGMKTTKDEAVALLKDGLIVGGISRGIKAGAEAFNAQTAGTGRGRKAATPTALAEIAPTQDAKESEETKQDEFDLDAFTSEVERMTEGWTGLAETIAASPFNQLGPEGFLKPLADPVNTMVGALGPAGGLIQGIASLGSMGADALKQMLIDFIDGFIVALVEVIPELLVAIPEILIEKLPEVIGGILEAIPKILQAVLVKLPIAIFKGVGRAFRAIWSAIKRFFSSLFSFGILQSGATITKDGMNYLHAGERVVPASGASTQTTEAIMRGASNINAAQPVTINTNVVDPNSIDQLARMLQRELGEYGSGRNLSVFNTGAAL